MLSIGARVPCPAGTGVERQPVPHDPPAVASSRIGISAWPRSVE
ncbi:MAG: hypothetical protein P4L92_21795 [Rudaea sp.]|nr:hypothetical protein [Rudaea sp.]